MPAETPTITTGNVLVGVGALYTAPANTPPPADSVPLNGAWGTPWVPVGATEEGVSLQVQRETQDIRVEEQSTPVAVVANTSDVRVLTALSEDTIESMKLAYGGGTIVTTAATTTQPPKKTLTLSDTLDQLAVGLEGVDVEGFPRRIYVPLAVSVAEVTTAYRRAANNRSYAVSLRALCPLPSIVIADITGVHT